jgi:hypothetical protein
MEETFSEQSMLGLYNQDLLSPEMAVFDLTEATKCGGGGGSNTSTIALRVVGADEREVSSLRQ